MRELLYCFELNFNIVGQKPTTTVVLSYRTLTLIPTFLAVFQTIRCLLLSASTITTTVVCYKLLSISLQEPAVLLLLVGDS
jgi:hypothetical protein